MLVQVRENSLRLIKQHHHAMISGWLAFSWQGLEKMPRRLPFELIFAVSLHDFAWSEADTDLLFNPKTGRPHDFSSYPVAQKSDFYSEGIDRVYAIHPYVALLKSMHYSALVSVEEMPEFIERESYRQRQIQQQLKISEEQQATIEQHLHYVRLFDNVSLYLCLTPPSSLVGSHPHWLRSTTFRTPLEEEFEIQWRDDENAILTPFPFDRPLKVHIPCYDLPKNSYEDQQSLQREWQRTKETHWSVRIGPLQMPQDRENRATRRIYNVP